MAHFLKGDVVRLKSGGPKLVVTGAKQLSDYEQRVFVSWFDTNSQQCQHEFSSNVLESADGSELTPEMIEAYINIWSEGFCNEDMAKQAWKVFMNAKGGVS